MRRLAAALTLALLGSPLAAGPDAPSKSAPTEGGAPPAEKPPALPLSAESSWMRKDLPVPAGFAIDESRSYIDEPPEGPPKDADATGCWVYEGQGQAQPADLLAFYRKELAARGWKPDGEEKANPAGDLIAAFKKTGDKGAKLQVTVSQHDGSTWLELKVE